MRPDIHRIRRKVDNKGSFRKNCIAILVAVILAALVLIYFFYISPLAGKYSGISRGGSVDIIDQQLNSSIRKNDSHLFPRRVSYMWKTSSYESLPTDTLSRWVQGCKELNKLEYSFYLYDDDYLRRFTEKHYPSYFQLFKVLSGVYMADMARILVAYHFGGIYMDLDFYCHKPFRCLEKLIEHKFMRRSSATAPLPKDILIVSNEPSVHTWLFKNKSRVIIQDFFMATPKHPFFKFILDDRLARFQRMGNTSVKGPFSYHIHKDIDAFRKSITTKKNPDGVLSADAMHPAIFELSEDVLHPLVDSSNHKMYDRCPATLLERLSWLIPSIENTKPAETKPADSILRSCEFVKRKQFFRPTSDTILVHMWTHVYLGWNFLRLAYNSNMYSRVEALLPPSPNAC